MQNLAARAVAEGHVLEARCRRARRPGRPRPARFVFFGRHVEIVEYAFEDRERADDLHLNARERRGRPVEAALNVLHERDDDADVQSCACSASQPPPSHTIAGPMMTIAVTAAMNQRPTIARLDLPDPSVACRRRRTASVRTLRARTI